MQCNFYYSGQFIVKSGEKVENLFMIKRADVRCYSSRMQYMYTLSNGGFFGEYNIMFGLYSSLNYQADIASSQGNYNIIF